MKDSHLWIFTYIRTPKYSNLFIYVPSSVHVTCMPVCEWNLFSYLSKGFRDQIQVTMLGYNTSTLTLLSHLTRLPKKNF